MELSPGMQANMAQRPRLASWNWLSITIPPSFYSRWTLIVRNIGTEVSELVQSIPLEMVSIYHNDRFLSSKHVDWTSETGLL